MGPPPQLSRVILCIYPAPTLPKSMYQGTTPTTTTEKEKEKKVETKKKEDRNK
jgi:hypothetical protein